MQASVQCRGCCGGSGARAPRRERAAENRHLGIDVHKVLLELLWMLKLGFKDTLHFLPRSLESTEGRGWVWTVASPGS